MWGSIEVDIQENDTFITGDCIGHKQDGLKLRCISVRKCVLFVAATLLKGVGCSLK
jgi:hypothetical protein